MGAPMTSRSSAVQSWPAPAGLAGLRLAGLAGLRKAIAIALATSRHTPAPVGVCNRKAGALRALVTAATIAAGSLVAMLVTNMAWAADSPSSLAHAMRTFLDRQILALPDDVEITVGEPDPRLNLAPCQRYEPFIPTGTRLWGRTTLGMRCVDGATWSVFIPVQIKLFAPAPVASRTILRNQPLGPDDVRLERVEVTQWPAGSIAALDQLDGRLVTRTINEGEPLRRDYLRQPPIVVPGDAVKILYTGSSFVVSTEGKALTLAADNQPVQAALAGGRILSGVARPGKVVEVR